MNRYDPSEARELWQLRYANACALFSRGKINVDVFRALLHGLGYRGAELRAEVNLHWPTQA